MLLPFGELRKDTKRVMDMVTNEGATTLTNNGKFLSINFKLQVIEDLFPHSPVLFCSVCCFSFCKRYKMVIKV